MNHSFAQLCLFLLVLLQVGLAVGDIEKIQVNALIDRYVMQVEQPLNSTTISQKIILSQRKHLLAWGRDSHFRTAGTHMGEFKTESY